MGEVAKNIILWSIIVLFSVGCGSTAESDKSSEEAEAAVCEVATGDAAKVDYVVISKESKRLRVYDTDNRLVSSFGVAIGRGEGDKQELGDMCTPEGEFVVEKIEDASQWLYDSGEGDGVVEGYYGAWFVRLTTPFKGIGIYGTKDPSIIGTCSTEGSIRLINSDLDSLYTLLREGMKVRIDATDVRIVEARAVITDEESVVEDVAVADTEEVATVESPKVEEKSVEKPLQGGEVWHTVADGELLGRIVRTYGTTISEIKRLNPDLNVDRLSIGQRILISDGTVAPKTEEPKPQVVEREGEVWYTLQSGDLVGRVAQRYGTTSKRIAELNPDINIDRVRDGQRIRVK